MFQNSVCLEGWRNSAQNYPSGLDCRSLFEKFNMPAFAGLLYANQV